MCPSVRPGPNYVVNQQFKHHKKHYKFMKIYGGIFELPFIRFLFFFVFVRAWLTALFIAREKKNTELNDYHRLDTPIKILS